MYNKDVCFVQWQKRHGKPCIRSQKKIQELLGVIFHQATKTLLQVILVMFFPQSCSGKK